MNSGHSDAKQVDIDLIRASWPTSLFTCWRAKWPIKNRAKTIVCFPHWLLQLESSPKGQKGFLQYFIISRTWKPPFSLRNTHQRVCLSSWQQRPCEQKTAAMTGWWIGISWRWVIFFSTKYFQLKSSNQTSTRITHKPICQLTKRNTAIWRQIRLKSNCTFHSLLLQASFCVDYFCTNQNIGADVIHQSGALWEEGHRLARHCGCAKDFLCVIALPLWTSPSHRHGRRFAGVIFAKIQFIFL